MYNYVFKSFPHIQHSQARFQQVPIQPTSTTEPFRFCPARGSHRRTYTLSPSSVLLTNDASLPSFQTLTTSSGGITNYTHHVVSFRTMAASVRLQRVARFGNVLLKSGTLCIRPSLHKTVGIKNLFPGNRRFLPWTSRCVCISVIKQQFVCNLTYTQFYRRH